MSKRVSSHQTGSNRSGASTSSSGTNSDANVVPPRTQNAPPQVHNTPRREQRRKQRHSDRDSDRDASSSAAPERSSSSEEDDEEDDAPLETIPSYWAKKHTATCFFEVAWFDEAGLPIGRLLNATQWRPFVEYRGTYYPPLVRVFYLNLKYGPGFTLTSTVGGTDITLTPATLAEAFSLPVYPNTVSIQGKLADPEFDKLEVLNSVCRDEFRYGAYPSTVTDTQFRLIPHLLHKVVTKVLLPRSGSKNAVSVLDLYLIWAMMNNRRVSLPHIIMSYMLSTTTSKRSMPYAYQLTKLLADQGVRLSKGGAPLTVSEKFGQANLVAMGYKYFQPQQLWVRPIRIHDPALRARLGNFDRPADVEPRNFDARDLFTYSHLDDADDDDHDDAAAPEIQPEVPPEVPAEIPAEVPPMPDHGQYQFQGDSSHAHDFGTTESESAPPPSSSAMPPYLFELQNFMSGQYSQLHDYMSQMQTQIFTRFDTLESRLQHLEQQRQQHQPPQPPPDES